MLSTAPDAMEIQPRTGRSGGTVAIVVGAVLTVGGGVPFVLSAALALSARFGPASGDPHGYTMIFGTLFAVICALPMLAGLAILVPAVIRRRHADDGQHPFDGRPRQG